MGKFSDKSKSLLSACLVAKRLTWAQTIWVASAALLVGLVVASWLDGYFVAGVDWRFRSNAYFAVTIPYALLVLSIGKRLWERAIEGVQPLMPGHELARSEMPINWRHEIMALLVGVGIAVLSTSLWLEQASVLARGQWSSLYMLATGFVATTLFWWMLYRGALNSLHLGKLCKHALQIDLFQANVLTPFARWSQFCAIAIIGAIALTLPLQTLETLKSLAIIFSYSGLLVCAVLSFFMPLRHIHRALVQSQANKLTAIRTNLQKIRANLEAHANQNKGDINSLNAQFAAWSLFEQQVKNAPTWPFSHNMVRQVLGSTLIPVTVYYLKLAGGALSQQLFP